MQLSDSWTSWLPEDQTKTEDGVGQAKAGHKGRSHRGRVPECAAGGGDKARGTRMFISEAYPATPPTRVVQRRLPDLDQPHTSVAHSDHPVRAGSVRHLDVVDERTPFDGDLVRRHLERPAAARERRRRDGDQRGRVGQRKERLCVPLVPDLPLVRQSPDRDLQLALAREIEGFLQAS